MKIALIALSSITAVILFLYLFSYTKKKTVFKNILSVSLFVVLGGFFSLFLFNYLPDSRHIFFSTILSFAIITVGYLLSFFNKPILDDFSRLAVILVAAIWSKLYFSTFFLYHISSWINIISVIFALLTIIFSVILLKNKKFVPNLWIIVQTCGVLFLNYCGFATLCETKELYSILLFAGCVLFEITLLYTILEYTKRVTKYTEPAKLILLLLSQALISSAGVLMIH